MKPFGFIIISYNRPGDLLDLLKSIEVLEKKEELLQEVIVVNNCSTDAYTAVVEYIASVPEIPIRYINAPENLGVAGGRNFAFTHSTAPLLIVVDDDIIIQTTNSLEILVDEFKNEQTEHPTAVISLKVLYYDTMEIQKSVFPHKKFDEFGDKSFFDTYYYAGCAHVMKREIIDKVGLYPPDFFYGMEEYDLSYRILDAGYSIVYSGKVVLLHKESPLGRKPRKEKLQMMWINKSKVAWRYLPKKFFYSTAFMWSMQYLKKTGFDLNGFFSGWKKVFTIPSTEKRTMVKKNTMNYLRKVKARLWY